MSMNGNEKKFNLKKETLKKKLWVNLTNTQHK